MSSGAKVVQIERNAKGKLVFLRISEPMEQQVPSSLLEWPSRDRGRHGQMQPARLCRFYKAKATKRIFETSLKGTIFPSHSDTFCGLSYGLIPFLGFIGFVCIHIFI